ncbi:MAG: c-type cytochrome, partial [Planctomycetales bacterium]|nr:c-type cytochrome [Planctomycetales bacterium]
PLKNSARRAAPVTAQAAKAPEPPPGVHLKPVDPRLKVTLIDRSPDQVYMGVQVDRDGHVFVGGREGVFVFETQGNDKFAPRQEILRFPQDSIIMGLEFRDDDLFVLTCNALYRVPRGRVQRTDLKPERILWGLPLDLHVSFHCLAWGPDGKLYITHGDPWLGLGDWSRPDHWGHWILYSRGKGESGGGKAGEPGASATGVLPAPRLSKVDKSWRETPFCGQGAVLQFDVDTGAIEVFATGLRGPVGLAFDDCGVLITNDNDHESRADQYAPARLLHVVKGIDFGWPRGWMASKTPDRFDLIEPMCDLGRGVPCDLAAYPFFVPDKLVGQLVHCRWDRHSVTTIDLPYARYSGAVERTLLQGAENCRPVGIAVGSTGEMFVTSVYMTGNMAAPYCQSDLCLVTFDDSVKPFRSTATVRGTGCLPETPYERQLSVNRTFSKIAPREYAQHFSKASSVEHRIRLTLGIGRRLTVPPVDYVPPADLPLVYPQESSFFKRKQKFWGSEEAVDLADFARIGSFTIAQRWKTLPHTDDEEKLFALLVTALDDKSDAVRLQAAYYLSLLNDARSEPLVEETRRDVLLKRLAAGKSLAVRDAWRLGPWPDGEDTELRKPHPPELGTLDLSASYQAGKRSIAWESSAEGLRIGHASEKEGERISTYFAFRATSGTRQKALATFVFDRPSKLFVNGSDCGPRVEIAPPGEFRSTEDNELRQWPAATAWIVDLQPGSNELLLRVQTDSADVRKLVHHGQSFHLSLESAEALEISVPEKLDSGVLAARLRDASAAGGVQPIGAEFLSLDWTKEHLSGDAAAGRKLFGTLGCAKCHAIVPDQKSAGAPSLFEARRRFTVPHLVESLLLPSRQVAEPFRAQQITTDDGLTLTGLVTAETTENVELLLPDASRRTLAKKQVEERTPTTLSPMPQGLIKTPDELRHLLAYLLSERPLPP